MIDTFLDSSWCPAALTLNSWWFHAIKSRAKCCCLCSLIPSKTMNNVGVDDHHAPASVSCAEWSLSLALKMSSKNIIPVLDTGHLLPCFPLCWTLVRRLEVRTGQKRGCVSWAEGGALGGVDPTKCFSCPLSWTGRLSQVGLTYLTQSDCCQDTQVSATIISISPIFSKLKHKWIFHEP